MNPLSFIISAWKNRVLVLRLAKREIEARYRGSFLGIFWSLLVPILLLGVYTFVFSVIFQSRWDRPVESKSEFALILFAGLILFNIFSECINRAPALMLSYVTYIKKVVFPLEILPWVLILTALFNALISFLVLMLGYLFFIGIPSIKLLILPIFLLPLILLTLGLSLFLSSLGVYLRDLQQVIGVFTMILMFLSPLFYPISAIPESYRQIILLNPLCSLIEDFRGILFWDTWPGLTHWLIQLVISFLISWSGYFWFIKTKKGFADVV